MSSSIEKTFIWMQGKIVDKWNEFNPARASLQDKANITPAMSL